MSKLITIPEDYNPANNQCGTLTNISGLNYSGSDITITHVKNALGIADTSLGALCTSSLINKWAAFKPGGWGGTTDFLNAIFTWVAPGNNFKLGDFIGYNHNATKPVSYAEALPESIAVEEGEYATFYVKLTRGDSPPAAAALGAVKTQIDIQETWNGSTVHHRVSVPSTGNVAQSISILPTFNGSVSIKPIYYIVQESAYVDISAIEDGFRSVALSTVPLQFTGTVGTVPGQTGGNPLSPSITWSITRGLATSKTVYCRFNVSGTGINGSDFSLGYLVFSGNETKSGRTTVGQVYIESSTGLTTTVIIKVQVSLDSAFTNPVTVAQSSFLWTNPGMPI